MKGNEEQQLNLQPFCLIEALYRHPLRLDSEVQIWGVGEGGAVLGGNAEQ